MGKAQLFYRESREFRLSVIISGAITEFELLFTLVRRRLRPRQPVFALGTF